MLVQKSVNLVLMTLLSIASICSSKKKNEALPVVVPGIKIEDASQARTTTAAIMHFKVTLDKTTTVPVSVDYQLKDGSALASKDYTAASGTINIPANKSNAEIEVQIKSDPTDTRQNNLEFTIQLSNPKGCVLSIASAKGII